MSESGAITRGPITREYWIKCSLCDIEDVHVDMWLTKAQATTEFRKLGWRKRNSLWICPRCLGTDPDYKGGM